MFSLQDIQLTRPARARARARAHTHTVNEQVYHAQRRSQILSCPLRGGGRGGWEEEREVCWPVEAIQEEECHEAGEFDCGHRGGGRGGGFDCSQRGGVKRDPQDRESMKYRILLFIQSTL